MLRELTEACRENEKELANALRDDDDSYVCAKQRQKCRHVRPTQKKTDENLFFPILLHVRIQDLDNRMS